MRSLSHLPIMRRFKKHPFWLAITTAGAVLLVDQLTKLWATSAQLVTFNTGISFGLLENSQRTVSLLVTITLVGLLILGFRKYVQSHPVETGLFLGGALANVLDRLIYGGVRDWLPLLVVPYKNNVADWAIFAAVASIVISQLTTQETAVS